MPRPIVQWPTVTGPCSSVSSVVFTNRADAATEIRLLRAVRRSEQPEQRSLERPAEGADRSPAPRARASSPVHAARGVRGAARALHGSALVSSSAFDESRRGSMPTARQYRSVSGATSSSKGRTTPVFAATLDASRTAAREHAVEDGLDLVRCCVAGGAEAVGRVCVPDPRGAPPPIPLAARRTTSAPNVSRQKRASASDSSPRSAWFTCQRGHAVAELPTAHARDTSNPGLPRRGM